jgi:hypothetical protein
VIRLFAILSLFLSFVFEAWKFSHGVFTWDLFLILGLLLWCISDSWDYNPRRHA